VATRWRELYGARVRLEGVRTAGEAEETAYLHGETPTSVYCPTGRDAGGPAGGNGGG